MNKKLISLLLLAFASAIPCAHATSGTHQTQLRQDLTPAQMAEKGDAEFKNENYAEAARWYRKAAEQGDPSAQCSLGFMYYSGFYGLDRDYAEADKWARKAAEQGYADAQCLLGNMYSACDGINPDYDQAVTWLIKAAEQKHAEAAYLLYLLSTSIVDERVAKNLNEARRLIKQAADQGKEEARDFFDENFLSKEKAAGDGIEVPGRSRL